MHRRRLLGMALALLVLVAATLAGVASADGATVSPDASQPWTGGAATLTPIEAGRRPPGSPPGSPGTLYSHQATQHTRLPYWSADCRPGGRLDVRAAEATAWR